MVEGLPVLVVKSSSNLHYRTSDRWPACGTRYAARSLALMPGAERDPAWSNVLEARTQPNHAKLRPRNEPTGLGLALGLGPGRAKAGDGARLRRL
jgi:hypothetical protein